jgi:hypothetical protein
MIHLDHVLLSRARRLINGANVHQLNTLIFQYEQAVELHNRDHPRYRVYPDTFEAELRLFLIKSSVASAPVWRHK